MEMLSEREFQGRKVDDHASARLRRVAPFRMKASSPCLLYIANNRLPTEKAHGLQIVKTCEALVEAGVKLTLWIPRRDQPESLRHVTIETYYGLHRKIPRRLLWCIDFLLLRSERKWGECWGVFAFWLQSLTFYATVMFRLIFRARVPIYSRDLAVVGLGILLGYPAFYEAHGFPSRGLTQKIYGFILKRAEGVVVITERLKSLYQKEFIVPPRKIKVAPDGVDLGQFGKQDQRGAREKLKLESHTTYVVYTGNLYPWKGVYTLVKAFKKIGSLSGGQLLVVGGDRHDGAFENLEAFIQKEEIPAVRLMGHVAPQSVADYLAAADILILPNSASDPMSREYTSPLKLFEYMAAGKPIIASDVPALREVLDFETAVFFRADDERDLAEKIEELMNAPEKAKKMVKAAQKKVRHYTWDERAKKIMGLLFP